MNKWQTTLFDALRAAESEQQLMDHIGGAAGDLGFDHYTYGMWLSLPLSDPALECLSNSPDNWPQRYRQMRYARLDPVVRHARYSRMPLVWTDEIFADVPQLRADARQRGLLSGWTQSSINANGVRGLLTLTRSAAPPDDVELRCKELDMSWLAYTAHHFLSSAIMRRNESKMSVELTPREVEILRWTGDGKTTGEISSILEISDNTVNYHVKNAMAKLQAANKTAAVVMALTQGLLAS